MISPLTELTRIDNSTGKTVQYFSSQRTVKRHFRKSRAILSTAPVLQPKDLTKPFYLWGDAGMAGYDTVLEQGMENIRTAFGLCQ